MYKFLALITVSACLYFAFLQDNPTVRNGVQRLSGVVRNIASAATSGSSIKPTSQSDRILANAFDTHRSNLQVIGQGTVTTLLPDDNDGSRHQRFILQLQSGQTLLIAHNIDLAPRIPGLNTGDTVQFYGEYEWNAKGGVIHWTHRDPRGRHPGGWLKHRGRIYQ